MKNLAWIVMAVALSSLSVACDRFGETGNTAPPMAGVIELSDAFSGDYALIDQNGQPFSSAELKGKVQLVYFGFATCPDVCPLALGRMSVALDELRQQDRDKIAAIFITVDPERDTPAKLKQYLNFDKRIIGLTGSASAAAQAREGFKVYASRVDHAQSEIGYTMDHSSLFFVVNRDGQPIWALEDTLDPQLIAKMVRKALGS